METSFADVTDAEDADRERVARQAMLNGELDRSEAEKRYLHPDGSCTWAALTIGAVHGPDDAARAFISYAIDITARKDRELRLQAQAAAAGWLTRLSAASLGDRATFSAIETALSDTCADPSLMVFEITETALVDRIDEARRFAERLTRLGCRFALDDFGTGYGPLTYLKHLPSTSSRSTPSSSATSSAATTTSASCGASSAWPAGSGWPPSPRASRTRPRSTAARAGRRPRAGVPISVATDGVGLNVTVFSYCGELNFGMVADREQVPDVWRRIDWLRESLEELAEAPAPAS